MFFVKNGKREKSEVTVPEERVKSTFALIAFILLVLLSAWKSTLFNLSITDPDNSYSIGVKLGIFYGSLLLSACIHFLVLRRRTMVLFAVFYAIQTIFISANLLYFSYFQTFLHLSQYFELWKETLDLVQHKALPTEPLWLLSIIDIVPVLYLGFRYKDFRKINRTRIFRYAPYLCAVPLIWGFARWTTQMEKAPWEMIRDRYTSETKAVRRYGLLTVNIINLFDFNKNRRMLREFDKGHIISKIADTTVRKSSVVLIQVESMDAFIVNQKHKGKSVTPFFNSLTRNSIYFPYALSYHKAGSTSDCDFSTINSVEPLDHFPSIKIRDYAYPNSMAKQFVKNGFSTAIFHGNRGDYFNRTIAFRKMGFPDFFDITSMGLNQVAWGAPDGDVFEFVQEKASSVKGPFFYHVITMTSHEPFTFTRSYYTPRRFAGIKDEKAKNYYTVMAYVDSVVGSFVGNFRKMHPETYFFIYGDHAPGIRDGMYHQAAFRSDDKYFEFVPLFILTPDKQIHKEKSRCVSFLDIAPTALSVSGTTFEIRTFGSDLLDTLPLNPIPFVGKQYDRKELFSKVSEWKKKGPRKK